MSVEEQLKIDPNTADAAALRKLPGVGPAIARRIIAARPFAGPQDLSRVPGLGKGAVDRLQDRLVFPGELETVASAVEEQASEEGMAAREGKLETELPEILAAELTEAAAEPAAASKSEASPESEASAPSQAEGTRESPPPAAPQPPSSAGSATTSLPPGFTRTETFTLTVAVGLLSMILSVLLTLATLAGINGTLDIRRHPVIRQTQSDLTKATGELQALSGSLQAIGRRLEALEGLTGRMVAVEEQVGALKDDVGEALDRVEATAVLVEQLARETEKLSVRVNRFDEFLAALREFLNATSPTPTPGPTEAP